MTSTNNTNNEDQTMTTTTTEEIEYIGDEALAAYFDMSGKQETNNNTPTTTPASLRAKVTTDLREHFKNIRIVAACTMGATPTTGPAPCGVIHRAYTLTLEHGPNVDIMHDERRGYWAPPVDPEQMLADVATIADAVAAFEAWRDRNELGGGNMTRRCGWIFGRRGEIVARISYNGRVWNPDGSEYLTK